MKLQFRIDIVGLDAESKPNEENIENGTTYYTVDSHKLFIFYNGEWYDQEEEFIPPEDETSEDETETEPQENNNKQIIEEPESEKREIVTEDENEVI